MIINPTIGRKYKCISFRSFGSGSTVDPSGRIIKDRYYALTSLGPQSGDPTAYFQGESGGPVCMFLSDFADGFANRKEHAAFVFSEIEALRKTLKERERLHERLAAFESDEEEIASVLIKATDGSELPLEERIKNLASLLKGRLKTDLI